MVFTPTSKTQLQDALNRWTTGDKTGLGNISDWDTSNITDMSYLFEYAEGGEKFNDDISRWNVSNVTNMDSMFNDAQAFNQNIGGWNVSKVTNMELMFGNAYDFDQPINTKKVTVKDDTYTAWDVSNVTNMELMFASAESFDQDISNWNVSNVTDMVSMFEGTTFNKDISNWNISIGTDIEDMFVQSDYTYPQPKPPPPCMSQEVLDTCEKDEDGDPECKISLTKLTTKTAVRTHPPPPHNEGDEPNKPACFDRTQLRRWLKNHTKNPVTKVEIEQDWINKNMGDQDCVPQTEGGKGKRKTKKRKSKKSTKKIKKQTKKKKRKTKKTHLIKKRAPKKRV